MAVIACVGGVVLWVGTVNLLLWTGAIERLVSGEHEFADVELEIGRAWMLRPDRVSVRDFALNIDGHALRVGVRVPDGTATVSIFDLLSKTLRFRSIRGSDVTLLLQRKSPAGEVSERRLESFPVVGSFGPPVRQGESPTTIPLEEATSIVLEDVDVTVARIWIDEFRVDPSQGRLAGGMRVAIGHNVSIRRMSLSIRDGSVSIADEDAFVDDLHLKAELRLDEWAPFEMTGRETLSVVSGALDGRGLVRDMASFGRYLPPKLVVAGGEGPVEIAGVVSSGVVQPGSRLRYETDSVRAHWGKLVIGTHMTVALTATEHDGSGSMRASALLEGLHGGIAQTETSRDGVTAPQVEAAATFAQTDLTATDWAIVDMSVSVPRLQVSDLGILAHELDEIDDLGGRAELSWKTSRLQDGRHGHDLSVSVRDFSLRTGAVEVGASVDVELGARTNAESTRTRIGKLQANVAGISLETPNGSSKGSWLRVSDANVELDHATGRLDARLRGQLDDLRPVITHASERRNPSVALPSFTAAVPLSFDVELESKRDATTVVVNELSRPALNLHGKLRKKGQRMRFAFWLRHARIGIYGEQGDEHSIDLAIGEEWVERKIQWVDALVAAGDSGQSG